MNENTQNYQEDTIDLRELWKTLVNAKVLIVVITLSITLLAIIYALGKTPIYEVKSHVQIGFIGNELIVEPDTLVKTLNILFNVEDKVKKDGNSISEVTLISQNKKLKNFIEIKTEAISNEEALKKNREVVVLLEELYQSKIDLYITNIKNSIENTKKAIIDIDNFEIKNIEEQINVLKNQKLVQIEKEIDVLKNQDIKKLQKEIDIITTQKIAQIDEKIRYAEVDETKSINNKISFYSKNLETYKSAIDKLYEENKNSNDQTNVMITSIQMVNYQNLILDAENKLESFKLQLVKINNETIPNLKRDRKNLNEVAVRDLQLKIDNINNITLINLEKEKEFISNDTIRKLQYKIDVDLPAEKLKLNQKIEKLKYDMSESNIQNSKVVGEYVMYDYPIKPKKKLIVVVAFATGLFLSVFMVFFLSFIKSARREEDKILV